MRVVPLVFAVSLVFGSVSEALAQTPSQGAAPSGAPSGFVPGKDQPTQSSVGDADAKPGARNRSDGQVSPPSKIDSGVQVMAPEKKR